jgi:hypothetical protein
MIYSFVKDTFSLPNGKGYAEDTEDNHTLFSKERKELAYYSQICNKLNLYEYIKENLVESKRIFIKNVKRHRKIIYGNTFYRKSINGLYADIVYFDFKHFYQEVFCQIADHIDENYFGRELKGIVLRDQFLKKENGRVKYSKIAMKMPLVNINDIAKNGIKIDANSNKEEIKDITTRINNSDSVDKIDGAVAKITRNAMVYGFGYQQKHALVSNISALVMFFAKNLMELTVNELEARQHKVIFSHTDSFMLSHFNTKDMDDSIKFAALHLNEKYFGGVPILKFDFGSLSIKNKFDELMILNPNTYIYSDRNGVHLAVSGINTTKNNGLGITRKGENLDNILNDNRNSLFSSDKEFFDKWKDTEFLYSTLKYRLDESYKNKLINWWETGQDRELQKRVVSVSNTIKDIYILATNK